MSATFRKEGSNADPVHDPDRTAGRGPAGAAPAHARLAALIRRAAEPRLDDVVIDLGAGTGLLTLLFAPAVSRVFAVDSSPEMLSRLAKKAEQAKCTNVEPVLAEVQLLPLPDRSVTLAISSHSVRVLEKEAKLEALNEAQRVLVPGGRLAVCDEMSPALAGELSQSRGRAMPLGSLLRGRRPRLGLRRHRSHWDAWTDALEGGKFELLAVEPFEYHLSVILLRRRWNGGRDRTPRVPG